MAAFICVQTKHILNLISYLLVSWSNVEAMGVILCVTLQTILLRYLVFKIDLTTDST